MLYLIKTKEGSVYADDEKQDAIFTNKRVCLVPTSYYKPFFINFLTRKFGKTKWLLCIIA